jgi:iron complex transport system ATP-binding protein
MMSILDLERIGFKYGEKRVLQDITLTVEKGEFFGILGPNGSGKSTLLNLIDGIRLPCEGEIRLKGVAPGKMKRKDLARLVAVVPQEASWVFPLTVEEVVLMGRTPHMGRLAFESERDFSVARSAMEAVDLLPFAERLMEDLSGGERQRVWIARALAQEPEVILLDEPTSSLDIAHRIGTFDLIRALSGSAGLTVVSVTHDINLASLYCDRIALLEEGRLHALGCPEDVLTESNIHEVYGVNVVVDRHPLTGLPRISLLGGHSPGQGSRWESGAAPQL